VHVHEEWMGSGLEYPIGSVQETDSARPPQELPGSARQVIAVKAMHIDRQLADRLAAIYQVRHIGLMTDVPDRFDRLHQTGVCRDPGERHESRAPPVYQSPHLVGVHTPLGGIRSAHDLDTSPARE
jgi:hypothetical protein